MPGPEAITLNTLNIQDYLQSIGLLQPSQQATVLVIDGQSNAFSTGFISDFSGSGNALDTMQPTVLREYQRVYILNPTSGAWEKLKAGTNNLANGQSIGIEIGLAQRWEVENPVGNLYLVKHYINGRPISDWDLGQVGYIELSRLIRVGKAALTAAGRAPVVRGFAWVHGESNAQDTAYAGKLQSLTNRLFEDGLLTVDTKVGVGLMRGGGDVAPQQRLYATRNKAYATAIETTGYKTNSDNLHYNAATQFLSGYTDYYDIFFGKVSSYPFPM